ncbi:MAG: hypothetical protein HDT10_00465 [Helicobacter sp.]|nr:hypothetical protein [Helicobacter sp.]
MREILEDIRGNLQSCTLLVFSISNLESKILAYRLPRFYFIESRKDAIARHI